jgi:hypothetical protein
LGPLLRWIGDALGLHGAHAHWWRQHGMRVVSDVTVCGGSLLLAVMAITLWHYRQRLPGNVGRKDERLLWNVLVLAVFGGSAMIFSVVSLPSSLHDSTLSDSRRLVSVLRLEPRPIYTDRYTAIELGELSSLFHEMNGDVRGQRIMDARTTIRLLSMKRGCILLSEPGLDHLASYGAPASASISFVERHAGPSWRLVTYQSSAENPLEHIMVLCKRGQRP